MYYAELKSDTINIGQSADFSDGVTGVSNVGVGQRKSFTLKSTTKYLYITLGTSSVNRTPASVVIENYEIFETIPENINRWLFDRDYNFGRNKINTSGFESGYINISTGDVNSSDSWKVTGFIPTCGRKKIGLSRGTNNFAFYDINKIFIPGSGHGETSAAHDYMQFSIPSGAYYVRISIPNSAENNAYYTLSYNKEYPFENEVLVDADTSVYPDFTQLRRAVDFAVNYNHTRVFVKDGIYDLVNEFAAEIAEVPETRYGIHLDNDIHIVFSSGALVTAIYTGEEENVTKWFQPFYVDSSNIGGFTLENLHITAKNTRYCVHDEYNGADVIIKNHYKNCVMIFDNTTAPTPDFPQCIGGGTGKNTYVDIDGCYFKSKRAESQITPLVSYHNATALSDAKSMISIHNSYFADAGGTYKALYCGNSSADDPSISYLSGNSFGSEPVVQAVTGWSVVNMAIIAWNNEIRE